MPTLQPRQRRTPDTFIGHTLFQPDALLKDQWDSRRQSAELPPVKRLMLAVLHDGIEQFMTYAHSKETRGKILAAEALEWIDSDEAAWPFSFVRLCEAFDIDPDYIRRGLRAWRERGQGRGVRRRVDAWDRRPKALAAPVEENPRPRCAQCRVRKGKEAFGLRSDRRRRKSRCLACQEQYGPDRSGRTDAGLESAPLVAAQG